MRKVFDSVNYSVLLIKLKLSGCSDKALKWFKFYFAIANNTRLLKGKVLQEGQSHQECRKALSAAPSSLSFI